MVKRRFEPRQPDSPSLILTLYVILPRRQALLTFMASPGKVAVNRKGVSGLVE